MRAYWQCAAGSILAQGSVAEVSRRIQLALFFDGKLDHTRMEPVVSAVQTAGRSATRPKTSCGLSTSGQLIRNFASEFFPAATSKKS